MDKKEVRIVAFVGMSGSGKSVAVDYMTEKGWPKVYFGGMILKEMERRGIERTAESEKKFREMIRETEGKEWVVKQVIEEVRRLIEAGQKKIVLDGVYSWTEYKVLKKEFSEPGQITFVAIVEPKKMRYKRVAERIERPFNLQEIRDRDKSEIENLEKGGPIAAADYYVLNDGSIAELHERIAAVLAEIEGA
ncbi:AAA family ATPase [Candidatus Saccharibacteria bacterium]|nr:AAA family ATPase [Candidatus Saccharibacteria bacterium]